MRLHRWSRDSKMRTLANMISLSDHEQGLEEFYAKALEVSRIVPAGVPFLEIGTKAGGTALLLLKAIKDSGRLRPLITVDPYLAYSENGKCFGQDGDLMYGIATREIGSYVGENSLSHIHFKISSKEFMQIYPILNTYKEQQKFGFVYLDGDHYCENVAAELDWFIPRMVSGGHIMVDDTEWIQGSGIAILDKFIECAHPIGMNNRMGMDIRNGVEYMNAIVTIAVGKEYEKFSWLTHPSIRAYADRIGAEFVCIDKQKISKMTSHWEKFQIHDLLNKYERIIYLDSDLIIRDDCPNLFDVVPMRKIGVFNEARFTDRSKELLIDVCKEYGVTLKNWDGRYFNSGVMVVSRCHKNLFKKPEKEVCNFYEQSYLNMVFAKENAEIFELEHCFNRMTCMDRFTGEERFASYIIHYAGYPNLNFVLDLIPLDLEKWKRDSPEYKYKKHIYVSVTGGYGDQMCAEPAIRFMRSMYPDDEMVVATHWPRMFSHLEKSGVAVCEQGNADLGPDTPYYFTESLPGPDKIQWSIVSHLLCHTVDYSAIALLKRTLPFKDRQIKFEVSLQDISNLLDTIGSVRDDLKDFVVVHPGKHWNSKTFPVDWWQKVIDGLVEKGEKVCVIGKDDVGDKPNYIVGARGTVDVKCPEGVIDFRNLLDLGSLAALLSMAKVLISNDSFPVHLAGAFDNWIILIPSCKHPDHVLPYRNGSIYYKAKALYQKLVIDDIESRPTQVYQTSAEMDGINWSAYLPTPENVILEVV